MTDLDTRPPNAPRFRRKSLLIAVAVVVIICVAVGLALFQPWRIFTRSTVDEALPVAAAAQNQGVAPDALTTSAIAGEPKVTQAATLAGSESDGARGSAPDQQVASVDPTATVDAVAPADTAAATATDDAAATDGAAATAAPDPAQDPTQEPNAAATEPIVLAAGTFVDGEHSTSGTASILQLPDGSRFVRLEGFSTSDGPDVHVWLSDQQAGGDDWGKYDDGRYLPLGGLKGTDGNQNYAVPADADLAGLSSVVIWCDRFNVAFGSAAVAL